MATKRATTLLSLLLLLAIISLSAAGQTARKALAEDLQPIKDVKDPHVQDIAKYAVKEHNKEDNAYLKLVEVVSSETQAADDGINYKLIITADDGPVTQDYEAVVWEKDSGKSRKLTSFRPLHEPLVV